MNIIEEIYQKIKEISENYLKSGISEEVEQGLQKIENWAESEEDAEILSIIFGLRIWNEKDEFKKLTIKIVEKYRTYLFKKKGENTVFIAHNDSEPVADDLGTFLTLNKYRPIIMKFEQCMGGTIFDKFKSIKFNIAIIVLTEDKKFKRKTNVSRAKQNVILEIGYAYAHLKEVRKVIILYDEKVEIPSNIGGVEYIKIDKNGKENLKKALIARGLMANG